MKLEFDAKIVKNPDGAASFLHFPFDIEKTFGTRGRVPVCGTINGFKFRSSLMPMHGKHMMCINKQLQAGAKARPGDTARFILERDEKPRTVTLPSALKRLLAANARAKAAFDTLSYSHRKEYAQWIAGAKQEQTIQRRLGKLVPVLLARAAKSRAHRRPK